MAEPPYRPLSQALANVSDEPPSKRAKWSRESQRKSDESGKSYDGPIVRTTDYTAATFETDGELDFLPIQKISSIRFEAWESCQREAASIAAEYPIRFDSVATFSARKGEDTALFPILLISVPSTREKGNWRPLLVSISQMLHAQDCLDLEVVINAPDPRLELKQYSVERDDPLVQLWPRMRETVQRIIGKNPWNTLGVLRIGKNKVSSVTTIVIGTDNVTEPSWPEIESEIKLFCRTFGAGSLETEVYLSKGKILANNDTTQSGVPRQWTYSARVQMGQSVGVDEMSAGTLGGHVRLVFPGGNTRVLGMTNYHVVKPTHNTVMKRGLEVKHGAWDAVYDRGNRDFNHNSPYSKVQAPSIRDHLEHFTTLQKEISTVQGQLDSKAHQKAKIDAGMATQEQEFDYNVLLDSKNVFQAELLQWCDVHKITSAEAYALSDSYLQALRGAVTSVDIATWIKSRANNIAYGGVRFTSGYRTTAPYGPNRHIRRLDWALIEPLSGVRTGSNDLPKQSVMDSAAPGVRFLGMTRVHGFTQESDLPNVTSRYFKIGRTTGLTVGQYNIIDTSVKLDLPPNSDHPKGAPGTITQEHTIIHEKRDFGGCFTQGGDSGSWLIDAGGRLAGLIFGGQGPPQLFTYFTPIEIVLNDIKKKTGCLRVELI